MLESTLKVQIGSTRKQISFRTHFGTAKALTLRQKQAHEKHVLVTRKRDSRNALAAFAHIYLYQTAFCRLSGRKGKLESV